MAEERNGRLGVPGVLVAVALVCALLVIAAELALGEVASWREEYAGGGSCKMRQLFEGPWSPFPEVLYLGLLAYPLAVAGALGLLLRLRRLAGRRRVTATILLVLAMGAVVSLGSIGIVGPALGICP